MRPLRHPRVLSLVRDRVVVEHAGGDPRDAGRTAVVAHFATTARVTRSFAALVSELRAAGYAVVVVSGSPGTEPLRWGDTPLDGVTVLRKPNVGYDFGSWAVGLATFPEIAGQERVILTNDSLMGPFASPAPLLDRLSSSPADVWGLTETMQFVRHLQSYFLAFRGGVLQERPLAQFWGDVRHYGDKQLVIHRGELGLARLLAREGFSMDAAFPAQSVTRPEDNPTLAGWRNLLDGGFPFVKRELVRRPDLVPDGQDVAAEVRRRFGADLDEWGPA